MFLFPDGWRREWSRRRSREDVPACGVLAWAAAHRPLTAGEGKMWRFVGIWSKNRAEWLMTALASMYVNTATVADVKTAIEIQMSTFDCTVNNSMQPM